MMARCQNCGTAVEQATLELHQAYCLKHIMLCTRCLIPFDRHYPEEHQKDYHFSSASPATKNSTSPKTMNCYFCELKIPLEDIIQHTNFCSSRTQECELCGEFVKLTEREDHHTHCPRKKICELEKDSTFQWEEASQQEELQRVILRSMADRDLSKKHQ